MLLYLVGGSIGPMYSLFVYVPVELAAIGSTPPVPRILT